MVFESIVKTLAEQFEVEPESITMKTNLIDDLGADSLDVVELLATLEDEFGVIIPQDAVHNIKTVGELSEYMETLI